MIKDQAKAMGKIREKRENLRTDVLIMSCDKMNTEFHLRPSI